MSAKGPYSTMAATGTTQATSTEIVADVVLVTTVTATAAGVMLPALNLGEEVIIVNGGSSHQLFIYPQTGGKLNNATANYAIELPPNRAARFRAINNLDWIAFF